MSLLIEYPTIPELVTGQVLGAAQLNAYTDAVQWLGAYNHAPFTLQGGMEGYTNDEADEAAEGWVGYIRHTYPTLHWSGTIKDYDWNDAAEVIIQYWREVVGEVAAGWQTVKTITNETIDAETPTWHDETIDLTAEETAGRMIRTASVHKIYYWRVVITNAAVQPFHFAETNALASGWATPATFTNGAAPSAANFNTIRSAANALYNNGVPAVNMPMVSSLQGGIPLASGEGEAKTVCYAVLRWRPGACYVAINTDSDKGATISWDVRIVDAAGSLAKVIATQTSTHAGELWNTLAFDLQQEPALTAISDAGITLTVGTHYQMIIVAAKDEDSEACFKRAILGHIPVETPHASWVAPTRWTHGDAVNATNLNAYKTDLELFYTGGDEVMTPEVFALTKKTNQLQKYPRLGFVRRKRYLYYLPMNGSDAPQISYGVNYTKEQDLTNAAAWQITDLDSLGIVPGTYYLLDDCYAGYECDVETDTAAPVPA